MARSGNNSLGGNSTIPFNVSALNRELLLDNPTYERLLRSDLHALVEILRQVPARWSPAIVAAEMKKISAVKWLKHLRTRRYLEREIPTLTGLLRATPTGFRTSSMSSQMADTILRHTFTWAIDTGWQLAGSGGGFNARESDLATMARSPDGLYRDSAWCGLHGSRPSQRPSGQSGFHGPGSG